MFDRCYGRLCLRTEAGAYRNSLDAVGKCYSAVSRIVLNIGGCCLRDSEHDIAQRQHGLEPVAKQANETAVAPFRPTDRDQVVDKQGEPQTTLALPADQGCIIRVRPR